MKLTSIDFANYIRYLALEKYYTRLNKTQVNKLLFICYGLYLAMTDGKKIFEDDTPKAWPFGPVFPRVYKTFDKYNGSVNPDVKEAMNFSENADAKMVVEYTVKKFHSWTAYELSQWSHQSSGPWYQTVYRDGEEPKWSIQIQDDLIKEYFTPKKEGKA